MIEIIKPKIVVLSPTPSHPIDFGNRKRIYSVLRSLKDKGFEIHFILYALETDWRNNYPIEYANAMESEWDEFHIIIPTVPYHPSPKEGLDHKIDEWWDPAIGSYISWLFRSIHADIFYVNYTYLSKAFEFCPDRITKVLDTHDKFSGRRELLASLGIGAEFFHTTEEEEKIAFDRCDLVLAIKEEEEHLFRNMIGDPEKVMTLPHSDLNLKLLEDQNETSNLRIGIIGGRNNINKYNFSRFLDIAIKKFKSYFAPIEIVIAGSICQDLVEYKSISNIKFLGYIDNVEEFYSEIDVCLIPMDRSSGQKIKTAEALAFGKPVISHAHAFEGYPINHPYHKLSNFEQIADACIKLSFDKSKLEILKDASIISFRSQLNRFNKAIEKIIIKSISRNKVQLFVVSEEYINQDIYAYHIASQILLASSIDKAILLVKGKVNQKSKDQFSKICRIYESPIESFENTFYTINETFSINYTWVYDRNIKLDTISSIIIYPNFIEELSTDYKSSFSNQFAKDIILNIGRVVDQQFYNYQSLAILGFDKHLKGFKQMVIENEISKKNVLIYCDDTNEPLILAIKQYIESSFNGLYNVRINDQNTVYSKVYLCIHHGSKSSIYSNYYKVFNKPVILTSQFKTFLELIHEIYIILSNESKRVDYLRDQQKAHFKNPGVSALYNFLVDNKNF